MNRNVSRLIIFFVLLMAFVFVLSTYSGSQAAETKQPLSNNHSQLNIQSNFFQANSLSTSAAKSPPSGIDPELVRLLKQNARGTVSISVRNSTGFASFVRVDRGGDLLPGSQQKNPQGKAEGFFANYGRLFGVRAASSELFLTSSSKDGFGATSLEYRQSYNGVPVFAGVLRAHLDSNGNLTAINGAFVPDLNLDTTPSLSADDAANKAIADVLANPPSQENPADSSAMAAPAGLHFESSILYVYRDGLIQDMPGPDLLVYEVVVTDGSSLREYVFVDADTGAIVNRFSGVENALYRRLFEQNTSNQVWQEGDPFPGSLNQDQQNIVNFSGNAYYFFFNSFGRDSYDAAGHEMQSVNNDPRIACPNANWNGLTTNYCNGVTGDDVVAHEWGHAYTEYTDNLVYQWQPGALNESYSDIWGETVDMLNGMGTDSPAPVRSDNSCSAFTSSAPLLRINSPQTIAGDYAAGEASFGPSLTAAGITGNVVLADDGTGVTSDACTSLVNRRAMRGNIALVDRGTCNFTVKVKNAQLAGATGVIVADNVPGSVQGMGGSDNTIRIPSLRVTLETGNIIKSELATTVNATLTIFGATSENSYRWLMGEDATAFGGAIRDMWQPICKGDPGKVTDEEYFCSTADGGGVHYNSGVPNHGYALLVDGGNYNGQTINGIGLVKAAHIYWRAQSVYQVPTSGFPDHADALEASCADLVGIPLEGLSTSTTPAGPSGQSITAADCAEVTKMIAAVELRTDPSAQCNFQPVLAQNPPPLCSTGNPTSLFSESFEKGLGNWTLTNQGVFSGWPGFNWVQVGKKSLPGDRKGSAAFATDPNAGNCDGGAGDISGMMSMESAPIVISSGATPNLRLAFMHYVATELGYDGGNIKISINGGAYSIVPSAAFIFNPYNLTLSTLAAGNTDPLAGQPAFSGSDGGKLTGSWGQSIIDLAALGVKPGDTIRLRYDSGIDGCSGNDGWYVDDLNVFSCSTP